MKFGMNMLLWTAHVNTSHYATLEKLEVMGYDGVELPMFEFIPGHFAKLGHKLDELGLARTAVTTCTADENPISPNPLVRRKGLDRLKMAIDCCQAARVTLLCGPIHSALGYFTGHGRTSDEWAWAKDILREAADYARTAGVTLVVEALNRFECYFLTCATDTVRFCKEVNHPHLRAMYDSFHAHIEEKDVMTAISLHNGQLAHVHISENDRSTPGEGGVNWMDTFLALKSVGYDGWLTVEAFGLAMPELAAATKIWRRMYTDELTLAENALLFMKKNMQG